MGKLLVPPVEFCEKGEGGISDRGASQLCLVAGSICLSNATKDGLGRHIEYLNDEERASVIRLGSISAALNVAASVWSKVSYASFLLRISSSGCTEWTRNALIGIITSLNIMLPVVVSMFFLSCRPVEKTWRPEVDGTCWSPLVKVYMSIFLAGEYCRRIHRWSCPLPHPR